MIIKSLTRKSNYFGQPVRYILHKHHEDYPTWIILHNMDCDPSNHKEIIEAFKHNDSFRKKRANGIAMYHEVLSFASSDKQYILESPYLMEELANYYIKLRTNGLAMAYPHFDTDHPHVHILMSANERKSSASVRISKSQFRDIKQKMETHMIDNYPQLSHSIIQKHLKKNRSISKSR